MRFFFSLFITFVVQIVVFAQLPALSANVISVQKSMTAKTGYDPLSHLYKEEYYKPGKMRWKVKISYCKSFPQKNITIPPNPPFTTKPIQGKMPTFPSGVSSFEWVISNSTGFKQTKRGSCDCELEVPSDGKFLIALRALNNNGQFVSGVQQSITIKDLLIVSLGDSYASGEGAPDVNASDKNDIATYSACELTTTAQLSKDKTFHWDRPAVWLESMGHRSLQSGHAKAALSLNGYAGGIHKTVTFISAATSGAQIRHLVSEAQGEWQNNSQINEIKSQIGDRPIDVILLTIGGNDISWAPSLERATMFPSSRQDFEKSYYALQELAGKYRQLNNELRLKFPKIGKIFLTEYPVDFFSNNSGGSGPACGVFEALSVNLSNVPIFDDVQITTMFGSVDNHEVDLMRAIGLKLNTTIAQSAQSNGWIYIGGVNQAFQKHGYCVADSYYTDASTSCKIQGDFKGILHPNVKGYTAISKLIAAQLVRYL